MTGRALRLERKLRAQLAKVTDQQVRDLVKAWATAWDEASADLEEILAEILANGDVTRSQMLKSKRLANALAVIAKALDKLAKDAGVRITADLVHVADDAGSAQAALIAAQLPSRSSLVDLDSWARVDERQLAAIVKRSTQQIHSSTKALSSSAVRSVRRELVRGVTTGSNPRETAARIVKRTHGAFNGGLSRALTIARTETLDAHREAARLGQEQHDDVLAGWQWIAYVGPRTCPACWGMHGTFHKLDEPGPHGHQCCRCARMPVVKPWSDLGFNVEEPPTAVVDADAAFARLTPLQQQAVLGRNGYRAWKAGKYPRSKWAKKQKNPGWRDSYVPSQPPKAGRLVPAKATSAKPPKRPTTPQLPPPTPPVEPPPAAPPMGRVIGTPAEQAYVKASAPGAPKMATSADNFHAFVPDPEDRTTAMLQYFKEIEELVKDRARSLEAGDPPSAAEEAKMRRLFAGLNGSPVSGIGNGNYLLDDLRADVTGAAYRLLARRAQNEALGTVYKGISVPGQFDLSDPDDQAKVVASVRTNGWWFTSASPDLSVSSRYSYGPAAHTQVILIIEDAHGVNLDSMGRMQSAAEVLLSGGMDVRTYHEINGVLYVIGRWKA